MKMTGQTATSTQPQRPAFRETRANPSPNPIGYPLASRGSTIPSSLHALDKDWPNLSLSHYHNVLRQSIYTTIQR